MAGHGRRVYRALAVPELWIYREGVLSIYLLTSTSYKEASTSPTFPDFDVKEILPKYIERAWSAGSSVALREFETFLISH